MCSSVIRPCFSVSGEHPLFNIPLFDTPLLHHWGVAFVILYETLLRCFGINVAEHVKVNDVSAGVGTAQYDTILHLFQSG